MHKSGISLRGFRCWVLTTTTLLVDNLVSIYRMGHSPDRRNANKLSYPVDVLNDFPSISILSSWWMGNWYYIVKLHAAQIPGTTQDHLQIFNIELKAKMKSHQMPEQVRSSLRFYTRLCRTFLGVALILSSSAKLKFLFLVSVTGGILEMDYPKVAGTCDTTCCLSLVYRRYAFCCLRLSIIMTEGLRYFNPRP